MTDRLPETIFVIAGNMDQFRTFRKQLTETIASEGLFKLSHTDIILSLIHI